MTSANSTTTDLATYAGEWTLDPARTSVVFRTKAMWVLPVKGSLKATSGGGSLSADGAAKGTLVFDAASIETGMKKRDAHLRTADFFDVEKYPTMTYAATGISQRNGRVLVAGTLTIRDQTRPLELEATVDESAGTATVSAEVEIDRRQWGVEWAKMGAGVTNHVEVRATFVKA